MLSLKKPSFREEPKDLADEIRTKYIDTPHRSALSMRYRFIEGDTGELVLSTDLDGRKFSASARTDSPSERAESRPTDREAVEKQLLRLGDTEFEAESIEGILDQDLFLPFSSLNALRRKAVSALEEEIPAAYRRKLPKRAEVNAGSSSGRKSPVSAMHLEILVSRKEQLSPVLESPAETVVLESTIAEASEYQALSARIHAAGKRCFLAFPPIFRQEMQRWFSQNAEAVREAGFDGFLIRTLGEISWLHDRNIPGERIADHTLYAMNGEAQAFLRDSGFSRLTVPLELSEPEIRGLNFTNDCLLLYGYLPMMLSANCLVRTAAGCDRRNRTVTLTDRLQNRLPVECICRYCMNRILNAVPLSLLTLQSDVAKLGIPTGRLDFTIESAAETREITEAFAQACLAGKTVSELPKFTRGHFRRKVD